MSMSMCVSPYLTNAQVFPGTLQTTQRSDLLEALLESCQRSSKNPQLPGYGRNLQPYFTSQSPVPIGSGPQKIPKTQSSPQKNKSAKKSKGGHSSGHSSEEEGTRKKKGMKAAMKLTDKTAGVEVEKVQGGTIKAVHSAPKVSTSKTAWAGPTFGVAPALEDIPMPSDFLLAK